MGMINSSRFSFLTPPGIRESAGNPTDQPAADPNAAGQQPPEPLEVAQAHDATDSTQAAPQPAVRPDQVQDAHGNIIMWERLAFSAFPPECEWPMTAFDGDAEMPDAGAEAESAPREKAMPDETKQLKRQRTDSDDEHEAKRIRKDASSSSSSMVTGFDNDVGPANGSSRAQPTSPDTAAWSESESESDDHDFGQQVNAPIRDFVVSGGMRVPAEASMSFFGRDILPSSLSPLMKAASECNLSDLHELIAQGAGLHAHFHDRNGKDHSALSILVVLGGSRKNFEACAKLLIDKQTRLDFKLLNHYLALYFCHDVGTLTHVCPILQALPVLARLMPEATQKHPMTFLLALNGLIDWYGELANGIDAPQLLSGYLDAGMPLNQWAPGVAFGIKYLTPLQVALKGVDLPIVELLLQHGADPNLASPDVPAPLLWLTCKNIEAEPQDILGCVQLLANHGANLANGAGAGFMDALTLTLRKYIETEQEREQDSSSEDTSLTWSAVLLEVTGMVERANSDTAMAVDDDGIPDQPQGANAQIQQSIANLQAQVGGLGEHPLQVAGVAHPLPSAPVELNALNAEGGNVALLDAIAQQPPDPAAVIDLLRKGAKDHGGHALKAAWARAKDAKPSEQLQWAAILRELRSPAAKPSNANS